MGNRFDGLRRTPAQRVYVDDIAPAYVGQQAADGGLLGGDGDVDIATLHQIHVGRVVDQRKHLLRSQPFGQQRRHDVHFVVVGQRAEDIAVFDVLLFQQPLAGGAAVEHHGAIQPLGERGAALQAVLDDLHLMAVL